MPQLEEKIHCKGLSLPTQIVKDPKFFVIMFLSREQEKKFIRWLILLFIIICSLITVLTEMEKITPDKQIYSDTHSLIDAIRRYNDQHKRLPTSYKEVQLEGISLKYNIVTFATREDRMTVEIHAKNNDWISIILISCEDGEFYKNFTIYSSKKYGISKLFDTYFP